MNFSRTDISAGLWLLSVVLATSLLPLWFEPQFYFHDDMQHQYMPVLMEIGQQLRLGHLGFITDRLWFGGNFIGEYQYALLNPVSMALYAVLPSFQDFAQAALFFVTAHYLILAFGVYVLARDYALRPYTAALASAAVCANFFVSYWLASSWIPGLVSFAWMPWALAGCRRACVDRRYILPGALGLYMVSASGWPHALVATAVIVLASLLWDARYRLPRRLHGGWFALAAGGVLSLIPLLPMLAFRPWTGRPSAVTNADLFSVPLEALLNLGFPTHIGWVASFGGYGSSGMPYFFAAIFLLPVLGLIDWARLRADRDVPWRAIAMAFLILVLLSLGPARLGLLRWPFRFIPYCALLSVLFFGLALDRGWLKFDGRGVLRSVGLCALGGFLAWQQMPEFAALHFKSLCLLLLCLLALWIFRHSLASFARVSMALTVVAVALVHDFFPSNSRVGEWRMPVDRAAYTLPPTVDKADRVLTLIDGGAQQHGGPVLYSGNSLLTTGAGSVNGYSPLSPKGLVNLFAFNLFGWSALDSLAPLSSVDRLTGLSRVELFGITRIIVQRQSLMDRLGPPVQSARLCHEENVAKVWCLPAAGGGRYPALTAWVTPGWQAYELQSGVKEISMQVKAAGHAAGTLILRRAWYPGFEAVLDGKPVPVSVYDGALMRIDLPPGAAGILRVKWSFPGRLPALFAGVLALGLLIAGWRLNAQRPRAVDA